VVLLKGIKLPKIKGIALYPFVIVSNKKPSLDLINHERIHLRQQIEMLIIFFYVWYIAEWLIYLVTERNFWKAYRRISFEKEAFAMEKDQNYLKNRPFWAFLKWL
jgi:hypothetical protein